ncbi:MAG TPA: histidine kinase dimerization/phospho-acceptor domain-containing protein, partial [Dissulfurispiraceae bacterium]|nr:histidine kinase dimerization/phospho-acceptor domain-containing protein [Dissulfurispiraceae bacterium]
MRVKQRLRINVVASIMAALIIFLVLSVALYRINRVMREATLADDLMKTVLERAAIRADYIRTGNDRAKEQYISKHEKISQLLKDASNKFDDEDDLKTIKQMINNHAAIGKIFADIVANRENRKPGPSRADLSQEIENRLLNQLNIRLYKVVVQVRKLQDSSTEALYSTLRLAVGGILFVLLLAGGATFINSLIIGSSIGDRVRRLRDGATEIGRGNLDHRIESKGDDEFAELAAELNNMAEKLNLSYRNLEDEIEMRTKTEEALRHAHDALEMRVEGRTNELAAANIAIKAERQRFLDMLDTLPVIIDIIRADHRIEWANRAYRDALGDNVGRLCYESQFGLNNPCVECQAFVPLKTGKPHNWEWTLPNGRTFEIHNFPFAAADGSPAVLEMDMDITEQRQAQEVLKNLNKTLEHQVAERTAALRAANEDLKSSRAAALNLMEDAIDARKLAETTSADLEDVNRELESFIYSASHDLRTPLRSMAGFAQIMADKYSENLDETGRKYLARIQNGSSKMSMIIDDLLHLSKISRQEMVKLHVDLSKMVSNIIAELREAEPDRSIEISIEEGLTAYADKNLIELAITNFVGNAWKFTSKTENARIEFGAVDTDGKTVYYIRDNGAGFDPKYAGKI